MRSVLPRYHSLMRKRGTAPRSVDEIARPRERAAAARSSSAAGCAIGCSGTTSKDVDLEVFGVPARSLPRCSQPSAASRPSARASRSTRSATSTSACPAANRKPGRGHKGFVVDGDPAMSIEEAARRRDFTINAISWDPLTDEYLDPFDGRDDLERRILARRRSADVRATTACACCAPCSSPRASSSRSTQQTRGAVPVDSARRSAGGTHLGRNREAAASRARPSIGFTLALDLGVVDQLFPELQALVGLPAGAGMAPGRRRLGAHAAGRSTRRARASTI